IGLHLPGWGALLLAFVTLPFRCFGAGQWDFLLTPIYAVDFGGWPRFIVFVCRALIAIALWAVALPRMERSTRALSIGFAISLFYLLIVQVFPWYNPPAAMLAFVVLAGVLEAGLRTIRWRLFPVTIGATVVLFSGSLLLASAWQLRQQQRIIEGQRKEIGIWLRS